MFHFPRLPPPGLCVQPGVTAHDRRRVAPFGNPGISLLDGSSWLIAVKPRPSSARSAKASTVRRSHLTCATPRAASRQTPASLLTPTESATARAASSDGKIGGAAQSSGCRQNHTRTSRARPAAVGPPCARVSRSPIRPMAEGMLWTHLITMSLVKAQSAAGNPARRGGRKRRCETPSYPRPARHVNYCDTEALSRAARAPNSP